MPNNFWGGIINMKKALVVLALALLCSIGSHAFAQDAGSEKRENIRRLLVLTKAGDLGVQIVEQALAELKNNLLLMRDEQMSPAVIQRIQSITEEEMRKEFSAEKMIEAVIPIYDKYLSDADVKALLVFYESPTGQKMTMVLPQILRESYDDGVKRGLATSARILEKLKAEKLLSAPPETVTEAIPQKKPIKKRSARRSGRN